MQILDANGKAVELRTKLGEGGEGSVWASPSANDRAVKIYLKPIPAAKAEKLRVMSTIADANIVSSAAWPLRVVYNTQHVPVGFEMPKLSGQKPVHDLFGIKSRQHAFPNANWRMLVHAAANLASAFEGLHKRDIVVGDVNSNNVVVQADARVLFIDCDSFQIRWTNQLFKCDVGVPEYQPPELQGVALGIVDRHISADAFGMAIMIFQLLFLGKHPFMGRLPNNVACPPEISENIARGNYFYDDQATRAGLKPPPASLTLGAVTPTVAGLFQRAFRGKPNERPNASEWRTALANLEREIISCSVTAAHRYRKGISCPWCAIELQNKIVYFVAPTLISPSGAVDDSVWATFPDAEVERIWAEISKIPPPWVDFETPPICRITPAPIGKTLRTKGRWFIATIVIIVAAGVALYFLPRLRPYDFIDAIALSIVFAIGRPAGGAELAGRKQRRSEAQVAFAAAQANWKRLSESAEFHQQLATFQQLRSKLLTQRNDYEAELQRVKETAQETAQRNHLDAHFIAHARIKGIGPALSAKLATYNIETALDIDQRVSAVNGIGDAKARALFSWRDSVASQFRFNPSMIETQLSTVKSQFAQQRIQARNAYRIGPETLRTMSQRIETQVPAMRARALQTRAVFEQTVADMRPLPPWIYR